jgi:hypothetical protein
MSPGCFRSAGDALIVARSDALLHVRLVRSAASSWLSGVDRHERQNVVDKDLVWIDFDAAKRDLRVLLQCPEQPGWKNARTEVAPPIAGPDKTGRHERQFYGRRHSVVVAVVRQRQVASAVDLRGPCRHVLLHWSACVAETFNVDADVAAGGVTDQLRVRHSGGAVLLPILWRRDPVRKLDVLDQSKSLPAGRKHCVTFDDSDVAR